MAATSDNTTTHMRTDPACSIELQPTQPHHAPLGEQTSRISADKIQRIGHEQRSQSQIGLPSPTTAPVAQLQQWNHPRINMWRTLACFLGLFIMGANDAAYGAVIPFLETYYNISYTVVSLVFLSPVVGYVGAALFNNRIHMSQGQRGVAYLAPGSRLVGYIIISQHPPYPALVVGFILAGFGNGLEDAAWNAYIGNMQRANEILGFLHGSYGLGAVLSPIIATALVTKAHTQWFTFYYLMIGLSVIELVAVVSAFWTENGKKYQDANPRTSGKKGGRTVEALGNKVVWVCAWFLMVYVGIEVALGGWVVVYMRIVRHAEALPAGSSATGFWLGLMVGRLILGFVTGRIGEKLAILIYLFLAIAAHLLFWLVPNFPVSATGIAIEGFFIGPLFPAAVVAATKLLPKHLHVGGIGFAAAFGAAGATILPFAVGAIAQARGVWVLMPIVLAMLVVDAGIWSLLPGLGKKKGAE